MKLIRGYKVELKINNKQRTLLRKHAGAARFAGKCVKCGLGVRQKTHATNRHALP